MKRLHHWVFVALAMTLCACVTDQVAAQSVAWKPGQNVGISVGAAPGGGAVGLRCLNQHIGNGHHMNHIGAAPQRVHRVFANAPTWREQGIDSVSSFWHAGPKGMTPAQVDYRESMIAGLTATNDWKAQIDRSYLLPMLMKSAEATKFLNAQHAEPRSVLADLGMAKNP